ncbi:MAG TPA: 3'(2'),5'-bisphosphate nucleotidase CysQ, partial [Gammaproteobacteria bacterium]|nr:3'(2'),5'-bisphosphate nucleotidase CysQ [Gammaproteobacteria bacterium]
MEQLLEGISAICREAGKAILEVYEREDLGIQTKSDQSPLTAADLAAQKIIVAGLSKLAPEIPILSEESKLVPFQTRQGWNRYFLVDPLDGTKEFINRNGEFTVNVALIEENAPVLGVVYVPVQNVLYTGIVQADKKLA